jgi:hypothetical protein
MESNDENNVLTELTLREKKTKKILKIFETSKEYFSKRIDIFNKRYFSIIYLATVSCHSIFSGLGFSGSKFIGWFEIFIFWHKIIEIFRFKRSLDDSGWGKYSSFIIFALFSLFTTPISILARGWVALCDEYSGKIQDLKRFDNLFIQSFIVINIIVTLFPFPKTLLDFALNYLVTPVSYFYFKYKLN